MEGGIQLKANSLLCASSLGRCSCLLDLTVCLDKSCEIRVICVLFPGKKNFFFFDH